MDSGVLVVAVRNRSRDLLFPSVEEENPNAFAITVSVRPSDDEFVRVRIGGGCWRGRVDDEAREEEAEGSNERAARIVVRGGAVDERSDADARRAHQLEDILS